jgi:hypothetical protein
VNFLRPHEIYAIRLRKWPKFLEYFYIDSTNLYSSPLPMEIFDESLIYQSPEMPFIFRQAQVAVEPKHISRRCRTITTVEAGIGYVYQGRCKSGDGIAASGD